MSYLAGMRSLPIALRLVECARARHKSPCGGASGGATRSPGPNEPPHPPLMLILLVGSAALAKPRGPVTPFNFNRETAGTERGRDASER